MQYFFELLQIETGRRECLSGAPSKAEWKAMFGMAREQALVGVFTDAVCRLPEEMRPPRKPLARICSEVMMIEDANKRLFRKCCELTEALAADGFDSCVLKGQGMALLYPKPLLRQSGDIDIWMKPATGERRRKANEESEKCSNTEQASDKNCNSQASEKKRYSQASEKNCNSQATIEESIEDSLYNYARARGEVDDACYHHLGIMLKIERDESGKVQMRQGTTKNDEIEMHFRPSFMFSPRCNSRMQSWFCEQWPTMATHAVSVPRELCANAGDGQGQDALIFHCPTPQFNAVYALTHIYRHLFDEGIGLRQLLDYYYVIMSLNQTCDSAQKLEVISTLRHLSLYRFAKSVMYVLHTVFGLPADEMLVPMDKRCGSFLLDEIMQAGNFGHFDERLDIPTDERPLHKFLRKQRHGLRLLRYYPGEVLWQPYFRIWHRIWRLRRGWVESISKD